MTGQCEATDCAKKKYCKGWCRTHYERMKTLGKLELPSAEERFWAKVDKSGECWLWTGTLSKAGYAQYGIDYRVVLGHRYSYAMENGPIPDGMVIDHMCHNRACVNSAHLRCATQSENGLNRAGPKSGSKSGVLGVSWDSERGKWFAHVMVGGKSISAGRHATIAEAESAVKAIRERLGIVLTGTGRSE